MEIMSVSMSTTHACIFDKGLFFDSFCCLKSSFNVLISDAVEQNEDNFSIETLVSQFSFFLVNRTERSADEGCLKLNELLISLNLPVTTLNEPVEAAPSSSIPTSSSICAISSESFLCRSDGSER
jgi:hypothetical protein